MSKPRGMQGGGWMRPLAAMLGSTALLAVLATGTPASAQTITEAFAYTYNNNPQILAQRALLRATDEQVPQALSNWRPTVTFTGQAGETRANFASGSPG